MGIVGLYCGQESCAEGKGKLKSGLHSRAVICCGPEKLAVLEGAAYEMPTLQAPAHVQPGKANGMWVVRITGLRGFRAPGGSVYKEKSNTPPHCAVQALES